MSVEQLEHVKAPTDYQLLLSRLERRILENAADREVCKILRREPLWKAMNAEQQHRWADLAQMAGEIDTACRVYAALNESEPADLGAWQEHIDLLVLLGRRREASQVLARARKFVEPAQYQALRAKIGGAHPREEKDDIGPGAKPFEAMRNRQEKLQRYLTLFSGREDCFARQWVDRDAQKQGYVPVRRAITLQDIEDHFKGHKTYGIYLLASDGTTRTAVIDVDLAKDFRQKKLSPDHKRLVRRELHYLLRRIAEMSAEAGLRPVVEFSGAKGYHFWYLFENPVLPAMPRGILEAVKQALAGDVSAFNLEVFPKQDHLQGKGLGNLVKLPLGVHRLTGKRSFFHACADRSLDGQLDYLFTVEPNAAEAVRKAGQAVKKKPVVMHPRWEKWAEKYPELFALESRCPPIAQLIASCRSARELSVSEEKILFQTIGFLPRAKTLLHYLFQPLPEYNPHMVDFKISRVRGTPLGCRRIHSLLGFAGDLCEFDSDCDYPHPLLHLPEWKPDSAKKSEKVENLAGALENLQAAIEQTRRFLK